MIKFKETLYRHYASSVCSICDSYFPKNHVLWPNQSTHWKNHIKTKIILDMRSTWEKQKNLKKNRKSTSTLFVCNEISCIDDVDDDDDGGSNNNNSAKNKTTKMCLDIDSGFGKESFF